MADYNNLASLFSDIANAIRAKTGSADNIVATDFPTKIASISTGTNKDFVVNLNATISNDTKKFKCANGIQSSVDMNYITYTPSVGFYTEYLCFVKFSTTNGGDNVVSGYIDFTTGNIYHSESNQIYSGNLSNLGSDNNWINDVNYWDSTNG